MTCTQYVSVAVGPWPPDSLQWNNIMSRIELNDEMNAAAALWHSLSAVLVPEGKYRLSGHTDAEIMIPIVGQLEQRRW